MEKGGWKMKRSFVIQRIKETIELNKDNENLPEIILDEIHGCGLAPVSAGDTECVNTLEHVCIHYDEEKLNNV